MTDITELAQNLKATAEKATPGSWEYYPGNTSIEYNVDSMDEDQGSIVYVDSGDFTQAQTDRNGEFMALANPANILALVEALEKAQQRIDELLPSSRNMLMPALDGLSRDHLVGTIQTAVDNYSALHTKWLEDRQRIADLESRTVTVKLPEGDERDDLVISITEEIAHLQRCVERYRKEEMASTTQEMEQRLLVQQIALSVLNSAAGIKWEAE